MNQSFYHKTYLEPIQKLKEVRILSVCGEAAHTQNAVAFLFSERCLRLKKTIILWIMLSACSLSPLITASAPASISPNPAPQAACSLPPSDTAATNALAPTLPAASIDKQAITPSAPASVGKTYYVSPNGKDSNDGRSLITPWKTLAQAVKTAVAGDTVYLRAGTYPEELISPHSGAPGAYITFSSYNHEHVILDETSRHSHGIYLVSKSYIQIIGLEVKGDGVSPQTGLAIQHGSNHIIVDGVTVYGFQIGIHLYSTIDEAPVSNITIKNSKTYSYAAGAHSYIGNLPCVGNSAYALDVHDYVQDVIVANNRFAFTYDPNNLARRSIAIEVGSGDMSVRQGAPRGIIIEGNEIDHATNIGIRPDISQDIQISNNHIHDNGGTGIQLERSADPAIGSNNVVIENNLIENNDQVYPFETGIWVNTAANVLIRGNIIRNNTTGLFINHLSSRIIIHNNYIYDNNRTCNPNLYPTICKDSKGGATRLMAGSAGLGINNDSVSSVYAANNTFYNNGVVGSTSRATVTFGTNSKGAGCNNIKFINNIVSMAGNPSDFLVNNCTNYLFRNNDYFNTRNLSVIYLGKAIDWPTYLSKSGQEINSIIVDPQFTNPAQHDFSLQPASPARDKGSFLTKTARAGCGINVPVEDAGYFSDGIFNAPGDLIKVGILEAGIVGIDYNTNLVTLNHFICWFSGANVTLAYSGLAPNIGAHP